MGVKRSTIFAEIMRRLACISQELDKSETERVLSKYMYQLMISGYNKKFRLEVLQGALKRRQQLDNLINKGRIQRYRSRAQLIETKMRRKGRQTNNWHINSKITSTIKHMNIHHEGEETKFTARVVAKHRSCLGRVIDESLRIDKGEATTGLANSKSEWGSGALIKTQIRNKRQTNQLTQSQNVGRCLDR